MQSYVLMWKKYADYKGKISRKNYWLAVLVNVIITGILETITQYVPDTMFIFDVYVLAAFIPTTAITVRRLRDAGKHWANIFFVFLPIVGTILLIVYLCKKSVETSAE